MSSERKERFAWRKGDLKPANEALNKKQTLKVLDQALNRAKLSGQTSGVKRGVS